LSSTRRTQEHAGSANDRPKAAVGAEAAEAAAEGAEAAEAAAAAAEVVEAAEVVVAAEAEAAANGTALSLANVSPALSRGFSLIPNGRL
jgi:hypothetical protein